VREAPGTVAANVDDHTHMHRHIAHAAHARWEKRAPLKMAR